MQKTTLAVFLAACMMSTACVKRSVRTDGDTASTDSAATTSDDDFELDESDTSTSTAQTETPPASDPATTSSDAPVESVTASTTDTSTQNWDNVAQQSNIAGPEISMTGNIKEYVVKANDTLMLVAHNIYGDHRKWKDLKELNKGVLGGRSSKLKAGTVLKFNGPSTAYVQEANGEPYLIEMNDTLGKISSKVYQTPKRWKTIWKNNSYIRDPNLIFAGFTLYYMKDNKVAQGL